MVTQDKLKELLQEGEVTVTFTKKDGTTRVMKCTQNLALIPTDKQPKTVEGTLPKKSTDNVKVYDLETEAWRSFNYSTVTAVDFPVAGVDRLTLAISAVLGLALIMAGLIALGK